MLKTLALAGAAFVAMSLSVAPSNAAAWCAYQGGSTQYENCGYYTFSQCRAAVRGVGGDCRPNPYGAARGYDDDEGNTGYHPRLRRDYYEPDDED